MNRQQQLLGTSLTRDDTKQGMGLDSFEDTCAGHVTNGMSNSLRQHSIFSLALVTVTVSQKKNCKTNYITV